MRRRLISLLVAGLLVAGLASPAAASGGSYSVLTAMTYNLYVGADLFQLLDPVPDCEFVIEGVTPAECSLIVQTGHTLADVEATKFEERAHTLARLIANRRPAVIGLQEVSLITTIPTDPLGNPVGQPVATDYLNILLEALAARGVHYDIAASVNNANIPGPGSPIPGVPAGRLEKVTDDQGNVTFVPIIENLASLLDRDVILTRRGVDVHKETVGGGRFEGENAQLVIPIGGLPVEFTRSFVTVDVTVDGRRFTAANTHLEVEFEFDPEDPELILANAIQWLQAEELVKRLDSEYPIVLLGDFNSAPDSDNDLPGIPTPYEVISGSGYADVWNEQVFNTRPGYTCCQAELLDNEKSELDQRIDQIWLGKDVEPRWIFANTVGDRRWQKTPSGLWPSDHAGVVMYAVFR